MTSQSEPSFDPDNNRNCDFQHNDYTDAALTLEQNQSYIADSSISVNEPDGPKFIQLSGVSVSPSMTAPLVLDTAPAAVSAPVLAQAPIPVPAPVPASVSAPVPAPVPTRQQPGAYTMTGDQHTIQVRLRDMNLGYSAAERKNLPKMVVRAVVRYNKRSDIRQLYELSATELKNIDDRLRPVKAMDRGTEPGSRDYTKTLDVMMSDEVLPIVLLVCLPEYVRYRKAKLKKSDDTMKKNIISMENLIKNLEEHVCDIRARLQAVEGARLTAGTQ